MKSSAGPPPWKVEGLVLDETLTSTAAQPHAMKSLSWLAACMQAPSTNLVWGHFKAPAVRSSLFIETEDPQWLVEKRIQGLTQGLPEEAQGNLDGFRYWCPGPFDLVKYENDLRTKILEYHPDFAVLSTLQNAVGGRNMLEQEDMAPVMATLVKLARDVCPIVIITHSPWNRNNRRAMGSVTQTANYTTTLHFEKMENSKTHETLAQVRLESKAGGEESSFHLKLTTEGDRKDPGSVRSIVYGGPGHPKGFLKGQVIAALQDDPSASDEQLAERVGCSARYVRGLRKSAGKSASVAEKRPARKPGKVAQFPFQPLDTSISAGK